MTASSIASKSFAVHGLCRPYDKSLSPKSLQRGANHRQVVERSETPAYSLLPLQDLLPEYPHSELTSFVSGTGYGRTHEEPLSITTHNKMYERKRDYNIKDL